MKVVAKKINNPECGYITEGKIYHADPSGRWFEFKTDEGVRVYSLFRGSAHIDADWTIIGNPAVVATNA